MKLRNGKTYGFTTSILKTNEKNISSSKFISLFSSKYNDITNKEQDLCNKKKKEFQNALAKSSINSKIVYRPIITIDKYMRCSICAKLYKKGDIMASCSVDNINKHSYHKQCLKMAFNAELTENSSHKKQCPYCYKVVEYKDLKFVKII
tara:strand:+ start:887 stop:1333 length:447 start_codon:yes stop_codon:yes gene_type:complete